MERMLLCYLMQNVSYCFSGKKNCKKYCAPATLGKVPVFQYVGFYWSKAFFMLLKKTGILRSGRDAPDGAHHGVAAERADGRIGET